MEETKSNFYDPSAYIDNDKLYSMEKNEEDEILEGKIDPIEWKREMDRAY